jgi:hypothetical protein
MRAEALEKELEAQKELNAKLQMHLDGSTASLQNQILELEKQKDQLPKRNKNLSASNSGISSQFVRFEL